MSQAHCTSVYSRLSGIVLGVYNIRIWISNQERLENNKYVNANLERFISIGSLNDRNRWTTSPLSISTPFFTEKTRIVSGQFVSASLSVRPKCSVSSFYCSHTLRSSGNQSPYYTSWIWRHQTEKLSASELGNAIWFTRVDGMSDNICVSHWA